MKAFESDNGGGATGAQSARYFLPTLIALTIVLDLATFGNCLPKDRPMYLDLPPSILKRHLVAHFIGGLF